MALKSPFSGNNPLVIAKNIVSNELPLEIPTQYSEDLQNIVRLCLRKDE